MKTTKLYMSIFFHHIKKVGLENILISYANMPKDEKGIHRFHQVILERRELRKRLKVERQEKNFNRKED